MRKKFNKIIKSFKSNISLTSVKRVSKQPILKLNSPSSFFSTDCTELKYTRYGCNCILGFRGSYNKALKFKGKIKRFCKYINFIIIEDKISIVDIDRNSLKFLGVLINKPKIELSKKCKASLTTQNAKLELNTPIKSLKHQLGQSGFIKKGKACSKYTWSFYSYIDIVKFYNAVFKGFQVWVNKHFYFRSVFKGRKKALSQRRKTI